MPNTMLQIRAMKYETAHGNSYRIEATARGKGEIGRAAPKPALVSRLTRTKQHLLQTWKIPFFVTVLHKIVNAPFRVEVCVKQTQISPCF
ncbi:unnamed protein product [Allacma fusca]|uniref:Uncharacterized protein n=1 Tax=Allacma fusca TaxID=39272 RepID=A0A8J2J514_9HEXA|nr:unnamed protein product [Allacma fusca]